MTKTHGDIIKFREQAAFLGYEYLTWLFLSTEDQEHDQDVSNLFLKQNAKLYVGGRVVTCLLTHKEQKNTIVCPSLKHSHEIYASLKNGHVIEALSLLLAFEDRTINFLLHASDGAYTQVKITNNFENASLADDEGLSEEDHMQEEIFLRNSALSDIELVIEKLYQQFLKHRLDAQGYKNYQHRMRQKIESRLAQHIHGNSSQGSNRSFDSHLFDDNGAQ